VGLGVCLEARSRLAGQATLRLDVADFSAPPQAAYEALLADILRALRAAPLAPLYIGCRAGIGRTGMVMAGLAKLAGEADPIAFIRAHHHPDAVETPAQAQVVAALDTARVHRALAG
jgi:protein-tyrosine phosphatase